MKFELIAILAVPVLAIEGGDEGALVGKSEEVDDLGEVETEEEIMAISKVPQKKVIFCKKGGEKQLHLVHHYNTPIES